jgi:hypothetical protein
VGERYELAGPGRRRRLPGGGQHQPQYYAAPVEDLDAERYPFGFDTPGYQPARAAGWSPAVKAAALPGLTPDPTASLRLVAHKPVKITALGPGRYLPPAPPACPSRPPLSRHPCGVR